MIELEQMPKIYKNDKNLALQLRNQGKSYREIQKATSVRSRSTLSMWFKNFTPSPEAQKNFIRKNKKYVEKCWKV